MRLYENKKVAEIWEYLVENGYATEAELHLITDINGYNEETLKAVIYARTGYRSLEQLKG